MMWGITEVSLLGSDLEYAPSFAGVSVRLCFSTEITMAEIGSTGRARGRHAANRPGRAGSALPRGRYPGKNLLVWVGQSYHAWSPSAHCARP